MGSYLALSFRHGGAEAKPGRDGYTKRRRFRTQECITTSIITARKNVEVALTTSLPS